MVRMTRAHVSQTSSQGLRKKQGATAATARRQLALEEKKGKEEAASFMNALLPEGVLRLVLSSQCHEFEEHRAPASFHQSEVTVQLKQAPSVGRATVLFTPARHYRKVQGLQALQGNSSVDHTVDLPLRGLSSRL